MRVNKIQQEKTRARRNVRQRVRHEAFASENSAEESEMERARGSSGSSGKADGYQVRGPRFESQYGHNQSSIALLCPPNTRWVAWSLKSRLKKRSSKKTYSTVQVSSGQLDRKSSPGRKELKRTAVTRLICLSTYSESVTMIKRSLLLLQGMWGRVPADCRIWSTASTVVDRAEKNAQEIGQEGHEEGMPIGRNISEQMVTTALYKRDVDAIVQSDNGEGNRAHLEDEINTSANPEPFPIVDSHYCQKTAKRQYPGYHLNISMMQRLHEEGRRFLSTSRNVF
ncbi:hypothetical protein PoB_006737000 [Plakobranchus ocellatus]|uniref:Uncharacterized protein n=1 Tax=Plakobranchus ocellatus TaxID=259542 RepID=A0AAV4D9Z2_9GAST|nr:hypothetical protein PoB_006737000 [Plakobranchus ocellatus]